ncbi:MAG: hypothetical protein J6Y80_07170 [Victivallales bacterium]|nr:hypothetical protein [Victivallales bacterium]
MTGCRVRFPVHPALLPLLPREGEYVFPSLVALYQRSRGALACRFAKLLKRCDIVGELGCRNVWSVISKPRPATE